MGQSRQEAPGNETYLAPLGPQLWASDFEAISYEQMRKSKELTFTKP
jgi:hypothetical protein